nr:dioxygenase [Chthonobacter albigriseus]
MLVRPANAQETLQPTPACGDQPTVRQTEGPYFKPKSPLQRDLVPAGAGGPTLALWGLVVGLDCRPVAGALVDLWHADDTGAYDNVGYRCRGHQFTDERGRYLFRTVVPGLYPGRTRHYHVKVQAPGGPVLTTQLYFPGERQNAADWIFDPSLVLTLGDDATGRTGRFDFAIAT